MPRGYLKKERNLDVKRRRGGSSRKSPQKKTPPHNNPHPMKLQVKSPRTPEDPKPKKNISKNRKAAVTFVKDDDDHYYDYERDPLGLLLSDDDEELTTRAEINHGAATTTAPPHRQQVGECGICFDTKELMQRMKGKGCKHSNCCYSCYRQYYVVQAQKDVGNYPLRCWHPSCSSSNRLVHDGHIKRLVKSPQELQRHYRLSILARAQKQGRMVAHCPRCDQPRILDASKESSIQTFACRQCNHSVAVNVGKVEPILIRGLGRGRGCRQYQDLQQTIQTLESLQRDSVGRNDGWALCPRCKVIISKGDGCNHMKCTACRMDFGWNEAVETVENSRRYAHCLVAQPSYVP